MAIKQGETILRCSYSDDASWLPKEKCALICDDEKVHLSEYGAYLVSAEIKALYSDNSLVFVRPDECESGDFLRLSTETDGINATRLMTADKPDRTLFLTEQCNSNCVMCPYSSRQRSGGHPTPVEELLQFVELMNPETDYLCITGGEPTLLKEAFLEVLNAAKGHMPYALIHILTNGRTFFYQDFFRAYQAVRPFQTLLGIPLHASDETLHDSISGASGSFQQTVKGLDRCYSAGEHIELRVVTSTMNVHNLQALATFIATRYPAVTHVSIMGLEMMGNAMLHREVVWISYDELMPEVEKAVDILLAHGVSVRLFNFPLCKVKPIYHSIYYRSISGYKIRYKPECEKCSKKAECGGFFQTTIVMPDINVTPYS